MLFRKKKKEEEKKTKDKLRKMSLFTVKTDKGYIKKNDLVDMFHQGERSPGVPGHWFFFPEEEVLKERKIIVRDEIKDGYVTEFLTGEQFKYVEYFPGEAFSEHEVLDAFAFRYHNLSDQDLYDYIEKHSDVESYKRKLQRIKEFCYEKSGQTLKEEFIKQNIKSNKIKLMENCLDELMKYPQLSSICLEILSSEDAYLKSSPIDVVLNRLKEKYPNLTNEEYTEIVIILLKLQSNEAEKNKEHVK